MALKLLLFVLSIFLVGSLKAANLVPNSSFEASTGRGWLLWNTANAAYQAESARIGSFQTNSASVHGTYSMAIVPGTRLASRVIWLNAGAYTLTFSVRTLSGTEGSYYSGVMNPIHLDQAPTNAWSASATFSRITNSFTADSNAFYFVKIYNLGQPTIMVDGIQLESGTAASAYAPQATVECGLSIPATNNMWFSGDSPQLQLNFWNDGSQKTQRLQYDVFDTWNSNVFSATVSVALNSGGTTTTVALPARYGWFRVVSRLLDINESYDEVTTAIYPFVYDITKKSHTNNNDWLGGHPLTSAFEVRKEAMAGRRWGRSGPSGRNNRWSVVEPTEGAFSFSDSTSTNELARHLNLLWPLSSFPDIDWPSWATNSAAQTNAEFPYIGSARLSAYSTFCSNVVQRFKDWVHWWEVWNEPYQSGAFTNVTGTPHGADSAAGIAYTGTNLPINIRVATNYAKLLTYGITGITNADPTAKIIAMSGAYGSGEWAWEVWTNLNPTTIQPWITAVSTHVYAKYDNPNNVDEGTFTLMSGWIDTFRGVRPVWNSESGVYYMFGSTFKGLNGMFPGYGLASYDGAYDVNKNYPPEAEALRNEPMTRTMSQTMRNLNECLRSIGIGAEKFFYYFTVPFSDAGLYQTQPYSSDHLHVDNPWIIALSVAQSIVRAPGFGRITNAAANYDRLEMFMHTNGLGKPVATVWNMDRTNRTFTCSNSFFEVLDCMGNMVQTNNGTFVARRLPQYIRSGTLSIVELSNTLKFATVAGTADIIPPQTSIDVAPSGLWSGDTNRTLIKWTSIDDMWTAWATNGVAAPTATNVLYRWKMDGGPYTSYSQSNHVWLSHLSAGNHTITVQAKDYNNNAAEVSYIFEPPPRVLNVSGTANIGTITISP